MCGIVGLLNHNPVNQLLFDALTLIQHRGQDAAGVMTFDGRHVHLRKGAGLVRDVIRESHMQRLQGNMGIGHVRYPTAGTDSTEEAQPLYVNSPYGLSIVHNGNLINDEQLKKDLIENDLRHLNTQSDSEVLLNVFAHELQQYGSLKLTTKDLFNAVRKTHERCKGAYAVVIMINGYGLLGMRDPNGIRPLIFGKKDDSYMFSSERVALDALDFETIDDVQPGEAVFIDMEGNVHREQCANDAKLTPCIFEYVYLARPDSIIDGISVHKTRYNMGEKLAEKILKEHPDHGIDVVIPIPDTSRTAAIPLARKLNVNYREGFIKNRYVGRTFIMPGQQQRKKSVKQKLNPIRDEFEGKNVLLVDDSIVRGTTSKRIINMAREAGAKKVYFASAAPEVRYPNVYGIDMPAADELVAHDRSVDDIAKYIGADWLVYQNLDDLYDAVQSQNPTIKQFDDAIFTGKYITGGVDEAYLKHIEEKRGKR